MPLFFFFKKKKNLCESERECVCVSDFKWVYEVGGCVLFSIYGLL